MSVELLVAFAAACVVLALTPGPAMSLIIANTVSYGLRAGLWSVAGNTLGFSVLVGIAAAGMSSVMVLMADWFDLVRIAGALYLIWLGGVRIYRVWTGGGAVLAKPLINHSGVFWQGVAVALSNPKVILFLGAFLPQFVDPSKPAGPQLWALAVIFSLTLAVVDAGYALAIARARSIVSTQRLRLLDAASGALLLGGGLWLLLVRR